MTWLRLVALFFLTFLALVLVVVLTFYHADRQIPAQPIDTIDWGVTFSQKMSTDFGQDWKASYSAIVHDLKPQGIRLVAYWDLVQPSADTWNFADLDWQVDEAAKANIPVIIAVGQKVPRWPECHYPAWLDVNNKAERESRLLAHLQTVADHFKDKPNIAYWQVENEAFLHIEVIKCPKTSYKFVQQEVETVKASDPNHPVILTDSGQVGSWYKSARLGDAYGLTYYLKVHNPKLGHYRYPYVPGRVSLLPWLTGKRSQTGMIIEQQAEPWSDKQIYEMPLEQQLSLFTVDELKESIDAGRKLGLPAQYLWGVEWWYSLAQQGHPEYWDLIKSYAESRRGTLAFPPGFLWGAATAAHQVEGNQANDWAEWEQAHATELASVAEAKFAHKAPNWDAIKADATNPDNYISGQATDAYHRYAEDFTLAQSLGMNAQRISIEWSRIEPQEGVFDDQELAHYRAVVQDIKAKGMEPFVTLWHYSLPTWFADKGGWESATAEADFNDYVAKVAEALRDDVDYWLTMNEPSIYANNAYLRGSRPPQKHSLVATLRVTNRLITGHQQAYATIKALDPQANVGLAYDVYSFGQESNSPSAVERLARWWYNHRLIKKVGSSQDFIGVNYYIHVPLGSRAPEADEVVSDMGWRVYPEGLHQVLLDLKQYNKPIYITENGIADASDSRRGDMIHDTLVAVQRAIADGADVRGYFHWSLTDNFEWEKGFWPRFGLIEINYTTLARTVRASAFVYKNIITNNSVIK